MDVKIPMQLQKETLRFCFVHCKKPFEKEWTQEENTYKYNDPRLLERLNKDENYGVVGGYGNIMVVDADTQEVTDAFSVFPDTFTVKTGNGTHLYYYVPGLNNSSALSEVNEEETQKKQTLVLNNIGHITSTGRQAVAPGCQHYKELANREYEATGKRYEVIKDIPIQVITPEQLLAVIKPFLADTIRQRYETQEDAKKTDTSNRIDIPIELVASKMNLMHKKTPGYRGHNPDHPNSKSKMDLAINTTKNMFECHACCDNGYGYGNALYLIALNEGILHCHECKKGGLRGDKFLQVKQLAIEKYGVSPDVFPKIEKKPLPPLKQELLDQYQVIYIENGKKRVNCQRLAKLIMNGDGNHYLVLFDTQEILFFNGSYYEANGERIIEERINYYLDDLMSSRYKTEVLTCIKTSGYTKRETLQQPLNLINFKNGVLDINTWEIILHNKNYTFLYEIPTEYNKNATCPNWEQFIKDVVYPEDIKFLQEMCGYLIYRQYTWAIIVILLGHGRNGKTTYIKTISKVVGDQNIKHIPLMTLAHDQHAKIKLYEKHANLCSEIGSQEIKNGDALKQLTGRDTIYARDLYKSGFEFENYAKLIFGCNELPEIKDVTLAMTERVSILEFPNTFKRNDPECDPNIYDKLTTPEELSGILNWMITGLKRLLEQQNFSTYKNIENLREYKKKCEDKVYGFIESELEPDIDSVIRNIDLYSHYKKYCEKNNIVPLNDVWLGRKIMQFAPSEWNLTKGQKGKHTIKGLKIKGVVSSQTQMP